MRVLVQHRSSYRYPRPALLGPHVIRLRPADHTRAQIASYHLAIDAVGGDPSKPHRVMWQRDPHGNHLARVTFPPGRAIDALELVVELDVDVRPVNPFDFFVDDRAKTVPFEYPDHLAAEVTPFLDTSDAAYRMGREATAFTKSLPWNGDLVGLLVELNLAVKQRVTYVIRNEPGVWTPEETLVNGRGSCRDMAILLVALLRQRGIAARFVSGYLMQLADEGMIPNMPKGVARDVVDLHAWAEAYVPGAGWIGLDATGGLLTGEGHIPLACTASPSTAAPVDGSSDIAAADVEFATSIRRLGHEARPTAPYTDDTWHALLDQGDAIDLALANAQLEVWTGGEPTFTARGDTVDPAAAGAGTDAGEWQGGALGADKWHRGSQLANLLRDRLAPGGMVLHRMGKHYPGESLPRWALDVIARRDGEILWPHRDLPHEATLDTAKRFADELVRALGIDDELHAAYEDPWELLRTEAALPPSIDPRTAGLDDSEERRRLARIFDRGAGAIVGWVLPLARSGDRWFTTSWKFRRSELFLLPGDSPIGLRLPLGSIEAGEPPPVWSDGPTLPDPRVDGADADADADEQPIHSRRPIAAPMVPSSIRTAIAIQPRDGAVWIFLPPIPSFDDFCALIRAIDTARTAANLDVRIEGYAPPPSPVQRKFAVTPDPGVLEVNLPPATSCRELVALHSTAFDAALECGLTAERYMLDGRLAGSGGGNHITIGGPTTERSPWLARPDLLASLLTFVQHHPSLSYLFTGLFVGPTSQAPRIDEARHDAVYELELALPRLHERGDARPPAWQVDALLRHILVDVAGSTHRAEISIDKLYDPHTPFGRQGIVEMRAFEMPPHPRMVIAQTILVRALLASFVATPYLGTLARWGSSLHDRFLLPYWLWNDFSDVLSQLASRGITLPEQAYKPFVELRCPLIGTLSAGAGSIEIRNALEPWHVLGEEATQAGTSRYVDSSLERIEIRTHGVDPERYLICVNHTEVPLREAGGRDTRVGGVRFRAWAPPHALHPHLGIHHPLHLDVVDTWAERGVTGGSYHVWHPEGRAFDAAPLTRVEAEARRLRRFTIDGPSPSPIHVRHTEPHPDQPYTLDLRRYDAGRPMPSPDEPDSPGHAPGATDAAR